MRAGRAEGAAGGWGGVAREDGEERGGWMGSGGAGGGAGQVSGVAGGSHLLTNTHLTHTQALSSSFPSRCSLNGGKKSRARPQD